MSELQLRASFDISDALSALDALDRRLALSQKKLASGTLTLKLDVAESLRQLGDVEARVKRLGAEMARPATLKIAAPAPIPAAPAGPVPLVGLTQEELAALRQRLEEIDRAIKITRANFQSGFGEASAAEIAQLTQTMGRYQRELSELGPVARAAYGEASREAQQLANANRLATTTAASARGEITRLGLASQVKLGVGGALSGLGLQAQGYANGLASVARFADQARLSSVLFERQLERQNVGLDEGQRHVDQLAQRLQVVPATVQEALKVLLRNGYGLDQASELILRVGASTLAAGRTTAEGLDALADDVQRGTTVRLNAAGISSNQAQAELQYAKSLGVSRDALDKSQKAEAFLLSVRRETGAELADLPNLLSSLGAGYNDLTTNTQLAAQEFGKSLIPAISGAVKNVTELTKSFNALPGGVKTLLADLALGTVALGLFSRPLIGTVTVVKTLGETLKGFRGAQVLNETAAAATKLGGAGSVFQKLGDLGPLLSKPISATNLFRGALERLQAVRLADFGSKLSTLFAGLPPVIGASTTALKAFLIAAGPITIIVSALTALGLTAKNISQDTINIYDDIEKRDREAQAALARRGGTGYAAGVNKTVLLLEILGDTETKLGEARARGDAAAAAALEARAGKIRAAIDQTREQARADKSKFEQDKQQAALDDERPAKLKKLLDLNVQLAAKSQAIVIGAKSDFAKDMAQIAADFHKARADLERQLAGEKDVVVRVEIQNTLGKLDRVQAQQQQAALDKQLKSDKAAQLGNEQAIQQGRIDLMRDGRAKRLAQLDLELADTRRSYAEQIKLARENALAAPTTQGRADFAQEVRALQAQQAQAERTLRQKSNQDLAQLDLERAKQAAETARRVTDAARAELAARAEIQGAYVRVVENQKEAELAQVASGAAGRLQIEQKYAPLIQKAREAQLQAGAVSAREQIRADLEGQLRDAETAGARRGELELFARRAANDKLRALDLGYQTDVAQERLSAQTSLQQQLAALTKERLDKELQGLKDVTGAELASLELRVRARAALSGNPQEAQVYQDALKQIENLKTERVAAFSKELQKGAVSAGELRDRLAALAQSPLGQVQGQAAGPFNAVISGAKKQVEDLRAAYAKVAAPSPEQAAELTRQLAAQNRVIVQANLARNSAVLKAEQEFNRGRADAARSAAREIASAQVNLAGSDAERARARTALLALGVARVAEIGREVEILSRAGGQEERLRALVSERLKLEEGLKSARADELARARELEASQGTLAKARVDYSASIARSDAAVTAAKLADVALTVKQLAQLDRRIALAAGEGQTQAQINGLLSERVQLQGQLGGQQRDLERAAVSTLQSGLSLAESRSRLAAAQSGAGAVELARRDLELTGQRVLLAQRELASADQLKLTEEERRQKEAALNGLLEDQLAKRRALTDAVIASAAAQIGLEEARAALGSRDAVEVARRELAVTGDRVTLLRAELDVRARLHQLTGDERLKLETDLNTALAEQLSRQKAVAAAVLSQAEAQQALEQSRARLGAPQDALGAAARELQFARDRVALLRGELQNADQLQLTQDERVKTETDLNAALADQVQKQKAVAAAAVQAAEAQLALEQSRLRLGPPQDNLAAAARELAFAADRVALLRGELDNAEALKLTQDERVKTETDLNAALTDQAQKQKAVAAAVLSQAEAQQALEESRTRLKVPGGAVEVAARELDQAGRRVALLRGELQNAEALKLTQDERVKTETDLNAALADQQARRSALARALVAQIEAEASLAEARRRAGAVIANLAEDGVTAAQIDLDVTREQIKLKSQEQGLAAEQGLTLEERLKLQTELVSLGGQEAQQQRALVQAQRDRATLLEGFAAATRELVRAEVGGEQTPLQLAQQAIGDGRLKTEQASRALAQAYGDLEAAHSSANIDKATKAEQALTGAIKEQRGAVENLASAYRAQVATYDGVRDATERLDKLVNPEGKLDKELEIRKFYAVQQRRDAALNTLQAAITRGDAAQIQQAEGQFTGLEERYRKSAALLKGANIQVNVTRGDEVQGVLQKLQEFGISADVAATTLERQAAIADLNARAATTTERAMQLFSERSQELLDGLKQQQTVTLAAAKAPETLLDLARGLFPTKIVTTFNPPLPAALFRAPPVAQPVSLPVIPPAPAGSASDQQLARALSAALTGGADYAARVIGQALSVPAVPTLAPGAALPSVTTTSNTNYTFGPVTITTQPGQNGADLWRELVRRAEDERRRTPGERC